MTEQEFSNELKKLNILVSEEKLHQLKIFFEELVKYNQKTNLTRIINKEEVYLKHFYDSLTILKVIDLNEKTNLLDIGSGAGFPGIVLKIFYPNLDITLLDSNNKKTEWLKYISDILDLKINVVHDRVENFAKTNLNSYDIVTSRAVANLRVLSELSLPLVKENGFFVPLKGNVIDELPEAETTIKIMGGKVIDNISFNLPNNMGLRTILKIKKIRNSSLDEIRTYDKILKKPLKK